jgi:two-component system NtrC family response regulator
MDHHRILLIGGNPLESAALRAALCERGWETREVASAEEALGVAQAFAPAALVVDATVPGLGGRAVVALRSLCPDGAMVVTAPGERLEAAVSAMRAGADALLLPPLDPAKVAAVLDKALERRALLREGEAMRRELRERLVVVGESPELVAAREIVARVAPTQASMLVQGEPGTGRTHLGEVIHEASPRRDRPLVRISCAGVSDLMLESRLFGHEAGALEGDGATRIGAIERAEGGTLLVEEVHRLPRATQVKLLRLLQTGETERLAGRTPIPADVRVIAAATGDLAEEVRAGRFRADLFYRLAVVAINLPPLRARTADLPALASHLLARHARGAGRDVDHVSPGALSALFAHEWPGNVRELSDELQRAVARGAGRQIVAADLSPVLLGAASGEGGAPMPGASLFEIERDAILRTLDLVGGSSVRAAEILGVSVRKIQYRLREYRSGARRRKAAAAPAVPPVGQGWYR